MATEAMTLHFRPSSPPAADFGGKYIVGMLMSPRHAGEGDVGAFFVVGRIVWRRRFHYPASARRTSQAPLPLCIQRHRFTNELLQCPFIYLVIFSNVNGTPDVAAEA